MTDLPPPPPSRDLPAGVHLALRSRVLEGTYAEKPSHRRWLVPLAAAAAVLAVVFTAIGVLRASTPAPAPVTSVPPTASASPSPTGPPPANPAGFDPLWTRLTPGWLPAGLPITYRLVARTQESLRAGSYVGPTIEISITPRTRRGQRPTSGSTTPGPRINGKPSTWSERASVNQDALDWEWADGAQATVQLLSFPDDTETKIAIAARVAEGLRPQSPVRVALPFTVKAPPYARLIETLVTRYGEGYGGVVRFGPTAGVLKEVGVGWASAQLSPLTAPPNATANGRDASVWKEGDVLVVGQNFDEKVANTRCTAKPGAAADAVREECLVIAGGINRTGSNTEPSTWSTDPVR